MRFNEKLVLIICDLTIIDVILYLGVPVFWYINFQNQLVNISAIIIIVTSIVIINVVIMRKAHENQVMQKRLKMYDAYYPVMESLIEEIRIKQHDYHNHVQTIEILSNIENKEEYMEKLHKEEIWQELIRIDNKILMAFLYNKYLEAKKENILIKYEVKNGLFSSDIEEYDMIEMFGILIDNAIKEMKNIEDKEKIIKVRLDFENEKKRNIMEVQNITANFSREIMVDRGNKKHKADIRSHHGYGLIKLRHLVEKYKGEIILDYDNEEKIVSFTIKFPTIYGI